MEDYPISPSIPDNFETTFLTHHYLPQPPQPPPKRPHLPSTPANEDNLKTPQASLDKWMEKLRKNSCTTPPRSSQNTPIFRKKRHSSNEFHTPDFWERSETLYRIGAPPTVNDYVPKNASNMLPPPPSRAPFQSPIMKRARNDAARFQSPTSAYSNSQ